MDILSSENERKFTCFEGIKSNSGEKRCIYICNIIIRTWYIIQSVVAWFLLLSLLSLPSSSSLLSVIYAYSEMTVCARTPETPKITISHQLRVPMKIARDENPPNPFYTIATVGCYYRMQYGFGASSLPSPYKVSHCFCPPPGAHL